MIAKRVPSPKASAGFQRLGAYVLDVKARHKGDDPASWGRLGAYVLDTGHGGEKVAWARATNTHSTDPGWAVKEILAIQARNTRSTREKHYHLVVSFPGGERPTREQLEDIEGRLCEAIGLGEHMRVSAVHQNTAHWHLHVAICTVHPTTFRNVAPYRDHFRLQEACAELEAKHGLTWDNHTTERDAARGSRRGRAADVEAHQGRPSFLSWVRQEAVPALLAARDAGQGWQGLHEAAAAHGLVMKLRGAGLVIGHAEDGRLHVKASAADRGLSLAALRGVLGDFEPSGPDASRPAAASYAKPRPAGELHEAYRRERAVAEAARVAALRTLRARHQAFAADQARYYRERMAAERASGLRGPLRRDSLRHVAEKRRQAKAERTVREAEERRRMREAHPVPGWQAWLEAQAARGSTEALTTLRARQQRAARLEADILGAADPAQARDVVHRHLHPTVQRNGAVIYRVPDGGVVADEAVHVRVQQVTPAAAFLALTLAADRYGAQPLVVGGSDAFRQQMADLAGARGLGVTFADPALEQRRERAKPLSRGAAPPHALGNEIPRDRGRGE